MSVLDWHADNASLDRIALAMDRQGWPLVEGLPIVAASKFAGKAVPVRRWLVEGWIPACTTNLLTGEGGSGKSILGLQLCTCRALNRQWLGQITEPGRSIYLSCEDEIEELHRRLDAIREHLGVEWDDLDGVRLLDLVGADAVLGQPDGYGVIRATDLLNRVVAAIHEHQATLVVIDALADVFAGDENRRASARQFVSLLKKPARDLGCTFLLIAHPSLTGMASGTGSSGSTAWANSVRSRILFERARASDESVPDSDLRRLSVNKSNYAGLSSMTVKWRAGVFEPEGSIASLDKLALENRADEQFLALLHLFNAQGQDVSAKRSVSFAPTVFAAHPNAGGITKRQFEGAMQRLLTSGQIKIKQFGPPSHRRSRLVPSTEIEGRE